MLAIKLILKVHFLALYSSGIKNEIWQEDKDISYISALPLAHYKTHPFNKMKLHNEFYIAPKIICA